MATIFVSGDAQMAGFRSFVKKLADSLSIKGYAENLPDGRVKIVCEGEEENILKLENSLKETPPPFARVDHIEIKFVPYAGEFTSFERKGHDVIEEDENTTALLKSMVGYMKIFVDKSEVVNTRLGEIKVSVDDMHVTLKSVKEDTAQIPKIVENTGKILEHTSYIPAMRADIAEMKSHTSVIPAMKEDTAQIPKIVENTGRILEHTSHIPLIKEDIAEIKSHTAVIPAMKEDTAAIRYDTKEIATKLWDKYEELSKEIAQMKVTLAKIEAKVFA